VEPVKQNIKAMLWLFGGDNNGVAHKALYTDQSDICIALLDNIV
jgi:hypothetical protein